MDPRERGIIHEEECKLYFLRLGHSISVPIGECNRYDFILDVNHILFKIQCKKPNYSDGILHIDAFTTKPKNMKQLKVVRYDVEDVDFIASYYNGICYLIPYTLDLPKEISLRIEDPRSEASKSKIRWAREYEGEYIIERLLHLENDNLRDVLADKLLKSKDKPTMLKYIWITDGSKSIKWKADEALPDGFRRGRCGKVNQFT